MDERTLRALVDAGAVKRLRIIADGGVFHIDVVTSGGELTASTTKGRVKTWVTLDAAARWARNLGLGRAYLDMTHWQPGQKTFPIG